MIGMRSFVGCDIAARVCNGSRLWAVNRSVVWPRESVLVCGRVMATWVNGCVARDHFAAVWHGDLKMMLLWIVIDGDLEGVCYVDGGVTSDAIPDQGWTTWRRDYVVSRAAWLTLADTFGAKLVLHAGGGSERVLTLEQAIDAVS